MYISDFITIGKDEDYYRIYVPNHNSTVMVSEDMYILLNNLVAKYGKEEIDTSDKDYKNVVSSQDYSVLVKHNVITNDLNSLEERYRSFVPQLTTVYLHISQECNLRCTYCYAKHNLGKNMMMSSADATRYISQLYEKGARTFVLTGGEPLLNSDIGSIIDTIRGKKGTIVELLSNGTLLHDNHSILEKCDSCIISLDVGNSEQRRGISAIEILDNLSALPTSIKNKTSVRSVISKGEELLLPEMRKKIEVLGLRYITIPRLPNCVDDLAEFPDVKLIEKPSELIDTLTMVRCGAATSILSIDWNGDVYPCQNLMHREHLITNLDSPRWNEELKSSELRRTLCNAHVLNIDKCRHCDFRFVCGGGCRALSYNVYHSYDHCLDFYCEHFKRYAMDKLNRIVYRRGKHPVDVI